jgi:LysR family transcriptional regulator for metE and metH
MRHVTVRQLRTFVEVLRCGSFAAAAQALHLTPPAVTLQMRQLENAAGLPLFERSGARIEATQAGVEVANAAQRVDLAITDCADALNSLRGLKGGRVSIGVVSTAKYFAPHALGAFSRAFPSVEIRLEVGNRSMIVAALEANTLDLALTGRPPEHLDVDQAPIGAHPHVIVARPDHPLARRRRLAASVLASETFLVREPGSGTRNLMERFFTESRVAPHIGMEMASNETIKQAVMAGLGIAFLSAHTVAAELADRRLALLDIAGLPVVRQWFIVRLARRRLLPAAQALRQFLIDEGEKFLPPMPQNARGKRKVKQHAD